MSGLAGAPYDADGVDDDHRGVALGLFTGIALLFGAIIAIVITSLGGDGAGGGADGREAVDPARAAKLAKLPNYWTVKPGDTYTRIAQRTGLTVTELEDFNPRVDPATIQPGDELKLRADVPRPPPKPKGPKFTTVRAGDSFGSIAAKYDKNLIRLQRLNPKLKPTQLQPGDRIRLRR